MAEQWAMSSIYQENENNQIFTDHVNEWPFKMNESIWLTQLWSIAAAKVARKFNCIYGICTRESFNVEPSYNQPRQELLQRAYRV